jgi:hypothetical protein
MYIKKNMFENIFNTVIDMKGKTKENMNARMNIPLFCHRKNMKLIYNGSWVTKFKARLFLDNNTQLLFYQ